MELMEGVGLKIEIHEIHQNLRNPISLMGPIVSETCWNQRRQPPTLSDQRTWTVDEIEVALSLNFSILVECCLLKACDGVDFVSSAGFRGSRYFRGCLRWI